MSSFAVVSTCRRCSGVGVLAKYSHVEGGTCFDCKGSGVRAWASRDIRAWGWAHTGATTRIRFVQSAVALLSAEEGAPTARGWRDEAVRLIADVLPLLSPTHFDSAIEAIRVVYDISDRWVAHVRPERSRRDAA